MSADHDGRRKRMHDVAELVAAATEARTRLLDRIRTLSTAQGAFKPEPAEWSIAENVEHLVLAEQGSINRVWAAAESLRHRQQAWSGEPVHRGKSIEQIVADTWATRQQAPDIATPRRRGPLGYWRSWRSNATSHSFKRSRRRLRGSIPPTSSPPIRSLVPGMPVSGSRLCDSTSTFTDGKSKMSCSRQGSRGRTAMAIGFTSQHFWRIR
jgi:hypothetical protein